MAKLDLRRIRVSTWVSGGVLACVGCMWYAAVRRPDCRPNDCGEYAQTGEEEATIAEIRELALAKVTLASQRSGVYERDAHPAPHGCARAYFIVDANIPEHLRHGVFAQPGRRYEAWTRFSNSLNYDDSKIDFRGMSIKLMGVVGDKLLPDEMHEETQDFVMINTSTFPVDDVSEYLEFFSYQARGDNVGYFIGWNPFRWHLREFYVGRTIFRHRAANPLSEHYYSMLPYKLGPHNVKFSVQPCDPKIRSHCAAFEPPLPRLTEHYLREAMVEQLSQVAASPENEDAAARFLFRVQVQNPEKNMPIEHASVEWLEEDAPFVPIAELRLPRQRFSTQEQNTFCENLSFTPWHALPAHRPIGGLNRARRVIYDTISRKRHEENGVARHEPRGFCLELDGHACDEVNAEVTGL